MAREGGRGAGLRWLASLAAHIHHEHKCETVPKISDQVASCSRYDSRQKKKKRRKEKKKNREEEEVEESLETMSFSVKIIVKPDVIYIHALKII